jgi:DNA (cytosine-5)-methyltransferase 1
MTFGSLFAGIGGFDLGLERAGMTCNWQVEIDPYATRVLAKHWPNVKRWDDIKTFPPDHDEWGVDLVCGGFPCQPVSLIGKRRGKTDTRWLWPEFARVIRQLRPRFVLLENTPGLLSCGFDDVLGELAQCGYDAEWSLLSACSMGAPHTRERVFIVAYPAGSMGQEGLRLGKQRTESQIQHEHDIATEVLRMEAAHRNCGVPERIPGRVDHRTRLIGNAVVPQVAEWIGRRIMEHNS